MRKIKFRAWDKKERKMLYNCNCDKWEDAFGCGSTLLQIDFDGNILGYIDDDGGKGGLWEHLVDIKNRFELMQYTGLHDKNGKKIYEGDIIAFSNRTIWKVIMWDDTECGWNAPANLISGGRGNPWGVIGNIYENGDLLK